MKKTLPFLLWMLLLPLGTLSCGENAPDLAPPDALDSKRMSDDVATDLVNVNSNNLYTKLDEGFNTMISKPADLQKVMEKMNAKYGMPLTCIYKTSQVSQRVDGPHVRPSRIFWYAVKTSKFPVGKYYLKVEVVRAINGQHPDISGFGFLSFPKVPSFLR